VDGLGGRSELRDRAGSVARWRVWLRSARMSSGLQLEHLELLHKQLVIV
jgi:hypothetical protein